MAASIWQSCLHHISSSSAPEVAPGGARYLTPTNLCSQRCLYRNTDLDISAASLGSVFCLECNMQRNQMWTSPMVALALLVMVMVCSPVSSSAASSSTEVQEQEAWGFRRLLAAKPGKPAPRVAPLHSKAATNPNQDCSSEYPKLNFKPVTSVCNPKVAATEACCAAFNNVACRYRSQVNNFNSICPILFLSYLNYAGGYQDGYFIGKCVDGKKGLCV